jgi:hypothetical protein
MRSTAAVPRKIGIQIAVFSAMAVVCFLPPAVLGQPGGALFEPVTETAPFSSPPALQGVPVEDRAVLGEDSDLASIPVPATQVVFSDGFEGPSGLWSVFDGKGSASKQTSTRARAYAGTRSASCSGNPDRQSTWMVRGPFSLSDASAGTFSFRYWNRSEPGASPIKFLVSLNGIDFHGYQASGDSGGWRGGSIDLADVPGLGDVTGQPEVWIALVLPCGTYVDEVRIEKTTLAAGSDIRIDPLSLIYNQTSTLPIYVELDWMEDGTHSHRPSQAVIDRIVQTFATAGFTIHIDVSNAIAHQATLPLTNGPSSSPAVQAIMAANFNHSADSRYYYSIWGHNYSTNGSFTTSSGIADLPGRVHLVTLGSFPGQTGTFSHQVGTFIHEFGHNMGQRHGGVDHDNYKPNYLSVMNYHYQLAGVGPTLLALGFANTASGFDDFSYSHGLTPSLNENSLDESFGIGLGKAVDWNCSGTFTTNLAKDIQSSNPCSASGSRTTITDFDNWTSLASQIRTLSALGASPSSSLSAMAEPCVTWEEFLPTYMRIETLRSLGLLPPDGPNPDAPAPEAGMNANFFFIYNDGTDPLSVTSMALDVPTTWVEWEPQAPFTVPPGGSQKVHVYVDMGQDIGGTTTRRILVQSNDHDESPYPGGVYLSITSSDPVVCYTLTRSHTGSGGDPVALPASSVGCPPGQYIEGASIRLTASPVIGSQVASWGGTVNNASTSATNTATMPAGNHEVSVQYGAASDMDFYTLIPCRVVDTRSGSPLTSGSPATFQISGACGVPASAKAVAFNVTAVSSTSDGYMVLWPTDLGKPETSSISFAAGGTRANNGILALATDGSGTLKAESRMAGGGTVQVIIDINGYFE